MQEKNAISLKVSGGNFIFVHYEDIGPTIGTVLFPLRISSSSSSPADLIKSTDFRCSEFTKIKLVFI